MPDTVEKDVFDVLKGLPLDNEGADICDFTLEEHCAALETQGIEVKFSPNKKIVLGDNVTYIVLAVVVNENDEVLMIQEAKESCAGKWYLPAGRMEKGEDIITATKREVLEETGLNIKCTSLLMVECGKGSWFRFVLTGVIEGGTLKTPAQADKESLQAKWVKDLNELTLRAKDILPLVQRARDYTKAKATRDKSWHFEVLPASRSHTKCYLRLVVAIRKRSDNKVHVLLSERTCWHLPICEIHPSKSLHSTLKRFMIEIFGSDVAPHRPHGILNVELNTSGGNDGLCLTLLVAFKPPLEEVPILGKCIWHEASTKLGEALMIRVAQRNSTFPLNVIN